MILKSVLPECFAMVRLDENLPAGKDTAAHIELPPGNLYSDEPPLETDFHRNQIDLLIRLLKYWWQERQDFYISGNLTVYYNKQQLKSKDFRGPDVFVVLGTEKRDRRSWAIWEEGGKYPNVVIELLSSSTASVDKGAKKILYQDIWRVPEYYWFHPETLEFAGFRLVGGSYTAISPIESDYLEGETALQRLPSEQLGLALGIYQRQLRWFTAEGDLIPLPEEAEHLRAEQEKLRAEQEKLRAEQERQARERLENYLRSQGIDPAQLPEP
jgi:Uma2 family endonuclease